MMRGPGARLNDETKAVDAEMKPSDGVYYAKKNSRKPVKRKTMEAEWAGVCGVCSEKRQITLLLCRRQSGLVMAVVRESAKQQGLESAG
jgi:hypothetical protein